MLQFPRYIFKPDGVTLLVQDRSEYDQRLSDGWFSTVTEADAQTSQVAVPISPPVKRTYKRRLTSELD